MALVYLLPFIGALLSRWHGGGFFPASKVLQGLIWAVPFAYVVYTYNPWFAPLALALCALGKNTGHGQYFDLATMPHNGKPERLDFIISWLKEKIPEYWYDVLGLALVGFTAVSGALLLLPYNPLLAFAFVMGGLIKPIGYMIGWELWISPKSTEFGEYWTGFFAYLPFVL